MVAEVRHLDRNGTIGKLEELLERARAGEDDEMLLVIRHGRTWDVWGTRTESSHLTSGHLLDLAIARLGYHHRDDDG